MYRLGGIAQIYANTIAQAKKLLIKRINNRAGILLTKLKWIKVAVYAGITLILRRLILTMFKALKNLTLAKTQK